RRITGRAMRCTSDVQPPEPLAMYNVRWTGKVTSQRVASCRFVLIDAQAGGGHWCNRCGVWRVVWSGWSTRLRWWGEETMTPRQTVACAALIATLAATFTLLPLFQTPPARAATNSYRGGPYVSGVNGPMMIMVGRCGHGQSGPTEGEILAVQRGRVVRVLAR